MASNIKPQSNKKWNEGKKKSAVMFQGRGKQLKITSTIKNNKPCNTKLSS